MHRNSLRTFTLLMTLTLLCATVAQGAGASAPSMADIGGAKTLTIAGESFSTGMNPAFATEHPEVTVRYQGGEEYTVNQLLLDLTTQQATADIYSLTVSSGLLDAVREKGLCENLSASKIIMGFTAALTPQVRGQVADGDVCIGVPYELYSNQSFGFNTELGKALNIDAPRTYRELIDLFAASPENSESIGEDRPAYLSTGTFSPEGTVSRLLRYGMDAYIAQQPVAETLTFDTEDFRSFMTTLEQARAKLKLLTDADSSAANDNSGDTLLHEAEPILRTQDDAAANPDATEPLLLAFTDNGQACIPTELTVLIVNRFSEHKEIALQYLECLVAHYPAYERILVCEGERNPVEAEQYQENRAFYMESRLALEAQLQAADTEQARQRVREQLAETDACIKEIESLRWQIDAGAIRRYSAIAPYLRLMPRVSYSYYFSLPNARQLLLKFIQGEMGAEEFVRQFDSVQRMINRE